MTVKNITDEDFRKYVKESKTWSELLIKCGYNNLGNKSVVLNRINTMKLDYSHFPYGQNWAHGISNPNIKYSLDEILIENSPYKSMVRLKKRLIKELQWEYKCSSCKLSTWLDKPIPLEIEHINGIHNDNRSENICFLCPNCHALTDTYKGKNVKSFKNVQEIQNKCIKCQVNIDKNATRCDKCARFEQRKIIRPSYEQLIDDKNKMTFTAIGRKYNVTDNTIRKWIRLYERDKVTVLTEGLAPPTTC